MLKYLSILITAIITSSYYFPNTFVWLPTINTKLMLAVVGLFCFVFQSAKNKNIDAKDDYVALFSMALVFSLACLFSVIYNNTADYAYASYFISMSVWLFGAYAVCQLIQKVHSEISIEIVAHYLIGVCVFQCVMALLIDNIPSVKSFVDAYVLQDQQFLTEVGRLYGIGAMLDTAGIRFSIVLVLISYLISISNTTNLKPYFPYYVISFFIIMIIGNMMARTTTVGVVMGIVYLASKQFFSVEEKPFKGKSINYLLVGLFLTMFIVTYFYNTNIEFQKNIKFGFEGFFSLMEEGEWQVGSNEQLKEMLVFPETFKTWLIGDGYFNNPIGTDPYYVGELMGGYYMGTDIGYCRFIFYCGVIGLLAFSLFMWRAAMLCAHKFPRAKMLMSFLLLVNFICWMKVSTDTFLIFALLIMIDRQSDELYSKRIRTIEA